MKLGSFLRGALGLGQESGEKDDQVPAKEPLRILLITNRLDSMGPVQAMMEAFAATTGIKCFTFAPTEGVLRHLAGFLGDVTVVNVHEDDDRARFSKQVEAFAPHVVYVNTRFPIHYVHIFKLHKYPVVVHYHSTEVPEILPEHRDVLNACPRVHEICSLFNLEPVHQSEGRVQAGLPTVAVDLLRRIGQEALGDRCEDITTQPLLHFGKAGEESEGRIAMPREATFLRSLGFSSNQFDGGCMLSDFDWRAHGVDHPYLMFITGRCGSTWLTGLLEQTKMLGRPHEYFNEGEAKSENDAFCEPTVERYFSAIVRKYASNGCFGVQVDTSRYLTLSGLVDWHRLFPKETAPTFFMNRKQLVSQAYSYMQALRGGNWHSFDSVEQQATVHSDEDFREMWVMIRDLLRSERTLLNHLKSQGIEPMMLSYEELVGDRGLTILRISKKIGVSPEAVASMVSTVEGSTKQLKYDAKYTFLAGFLARYGPVVDHLTENRNTIEVTELEAMLARFDVPL